MAKLKKSGPRKFLGGFAPMSNHAAASSAAATTTADTVPKAASRLLVKSPSKLRTALTTKQPPRPPGTGMKSVVNNSGSCAPTVAPQPPPLLVDGSASSTSRCCCCCSSSSCSKATSPPGHQDPDPILMQPVNLGSKNVRGLIKSVTQGTSEIQDLILNECDIIFECKVCRSLFRSLCNFTDHKRQFCRSRACDLPVLHDAQRVGRSAAARSPTRPSQDFYTIEPTDPIAPPLILPSSVASEVLANGITIPPSRRARRLDVCIQKLTQEKQRTVGQQSLLLTPISTSDKAMFLTRTNVIQDQEEAAPDAKEIAETNSVAEAESSSMDSTESLDLRVKQSPNPPNITNDSVSLLQPSGAASSTTPPPAEPVRRVGNCRPVNCTICNSEFVSNKTLRVHMKTLHATKRLIYPCPFCHLTFTQICNATRHMHQVHKKGKLDVKRLREIVRSRAKVADEPVPRSKSPDKQESDPGFHEDMDLTPDTDRSGAADSLPEPEVKEEEEEQLEPTEEPTAAVHESEHVCQGCNKYFPRIASKIGHEKVCDALKKPIKKRGRVDQVRPSSRTDEFGFHPFDSVYDNEPITITAVIKAGLQKVASTKKLKCYECPTLKFKNNVHLIRHAVAHMNEEIFACNDCVYQSLSKADIDSHAAIKHGNEPVKGSPPNKIVIEPSEIVTVRDEEFSLVSDSDPSKTAPRQTHRAVSAYNTTRLKARKKVFKKRVMAKKLAAAALVTATEVTSPVSAVTEPQPLPPAPVPLLPAPPPPPPPPPETVVKDEPIVNLPPPPPLMPQPVLPVIQPPLIPDESKSDAAVSESVIQPVPTLIPSIPTMCDEVQTKMEPELPPSPPPLPPPQLQQQPVARRAIAGIWPKRPNRRTGQRSLPVVPVKKPFGGQIKKRIGQVKQMKYKDVGGFKSQPVTSSTTVPIVTGPSSSSDPAIQPLKILIHKGVTSDKKITYAVTSVTDQNP